MRGSTFRSKASRALASICGCVLALLLVLNAALFIHRPAAWADETATDDSSATLDMTYEGGR